MATDSRPARESKYKSSWSLTSSTIGYRLHAVSLHELSDHCRPRCRLGSTRLDILCRSVRGVRHEPKSCTRFGNPSKISDFSHFILKTFCSLLLCYHSNNKLIQLLADFSKQRIKYLVLKLWFLIHALMRNYTVSSHAILEILNCL